MSFLIKYLKAGGSGNPASLIPALWNIGILLYEKATQTKHFDGNCTRYLSKDYVSLAATKQNGFNIN